MKSIKELDCQTYKFKEGDLVRFTLDDELTLYGIGLVLTSVFNKKGYKTYKVYWVNKKKIVMDYEICLEFLDGEKETGV